MNGRAKPFSLKTLVALVIANMIGAGVFTTSGYALADLGSPHAVMMAWVVGGFVAILGALSYGMLAANVHESGGEYLYLSRNIHPAAGFVAGWVSMLAGFTGAIAFASMTFESYALHNTLSPAWLHEGMLASAVILLAGLLHGLKAAPGAWIQNILVMIKLVALSGFITYAVMQPPQSLAFEIPVFSVDQPLLAFATSLMWISFSFSGFNAAIYIAGEAKNPKINVPRALLFGTLITAAFYMLLNAVFVYWPPLDAVRGTTEVAAVAAEAIGGKTFSDILRLIIALALVTSVFSMMMAGPRVYAQMAKDGVFPKCFRHDGEVPKSAIMLQVVMALAMVWVSDLRDLLSYLGFTLSLSAAFTVSTLFKTYHNTFIKPRFYPYAPILFVGFTLLFAGLAAIRNPWECLAGVVSVLSALGVYYASEEVRQRKERRQLYGTS